MYRGFYVTPSLDFEEFRAIGKKMFDANRAIIKTKLDSYLLPGGALDGSEMQDNWFPQIEADIFISHSHADTDVAIGFAGWLYYNFKIKSFIDSCVWGYANELLRSIDDMYCPNEDKKSYNYNKRNYSTSHVHMMLSTALSKMIHKTECLFFLKTDNSISLSTSKVVGKTESPWLYNEIAMSQLIEHVTPTRRLHQDTKMFSKAERGGPVNEDLRIVYDASLKHLTPLELSNLLMWEISHTGTTAKEALDTLYDEIKPLTTSNYI